MASPFPGMDPYLEDPAFWRDFHQTFIGCWREAIAEELPEAYEARLDETVNLVHMEDATRTIDPDVSVTRSPGAVRSKAKSTSTALLEPVTIPHEYLDEETQGSIQILHRRDRSLIAVLELLSPPLLQVQKTPFVKAIRPMCRPHRLFLPSVRCC